MFPTAFLILCFVFQWASTAALPRRYNDTLVLQKARGLDIPIRTSKTPGGNARRGDVSGSIGLGNNADLLYTVPIELGNTVVAVNIDTGSSDLWVVSDTCTAGTCAGSAVTRYPESSLISAGADVSMFYGDSSTGTHAFGSVGLDTATIAGVTMTQQSFGLVNDTNNQIVQFSTAGIFGLGFPSGSKIQEAVTVAKHGAINQTDDFLRSTYTSGPLLTRIAMTGALEMPMFSITLQRSTIDISGTGLLTIGKLPDGVDNSTLTWVPVRLYDPEDGGLDPPTFAPNEVYPFRWEIDIDAVYFDGQKLPDSTIKAIDGVDSKRVSALIDTGNSLLRGPQDVVNNILTSVSPSYDPNQSGAVPTLPCNLPKTISFQIGGKMFPIDPRDFIGQQNTGDATTCVADNLVTTDPPSMGSLFRWSLGAPFLRSNLVAFHHGNLTHPSVDPPRIGIKSNVPANAAALLKQAVADAVNNGGNFEQTLVVAPTASAAAEPQITVSPGSFTSQGTITTILTGTTPATTPARGGSTTLSLAAPDNTAAPTSNARNAASSLVPTFYRDTWFYLVPSFFFLLM